MTALYNKPGIPHRGWLCRNPEGFDTEELEHHCEMCGTAIRYLYYMEHPEYSGTLTVGSECTLNMSEDYAQIQNHKRARASLRNKLKNFMLKHWQTYTDDHNNEVLYKSYKNFTVGILKINGFYRFIVDGNLRPWQHKTIDEAKRHSFEYILKRLT